MEVLAVPARDREIPAAVRREVIARDGLVCQLCGVAVTAQTLHLDHVIPWASGGESTVENLRVSCAPCNLSRPRPVFVTRRVVRGAPLPPWITLKPAEARRARRRQGIAEPFELDQELRAKLDAELAHVRTLSARQQRAS